MVGNQGDILKFFQLFYANTLKIITAHFNVLSKVFNISISFIH